MPSPIERLAALERLWERFAAEPQPIPEARPIPEAQPIPTASRLPSSPSLPVARALPGDLPTAFTPGPARLPTAIPLDRPALPAGSVPPVATPISPPSQPAGSLASVAAPAPVAPAASASPIPTARPLTAGGGADQGIVPLLQQILRELEKIARAGSLQSKPGSDLPNMHEPAAGRRSGGSAPEGVGHWSAEPAAPSVRVRHVGGRGRE